MSIGESTTEDKVLARQEIDAQMAEFLAKGGKITECAPHESAYNEDDTVFMKKKLRHSK